MSDVVERVEALISKHLWCSCDSRDRSGFHPRHAAEKVVEALGLREEQYRSAMCPDEFGLRPGALGFSVGAVRTRERAVKVWIDHDDGHAGGYPHTCERCPTCGRHNQDERAVYCSNVWHLTGEDRIPEPQPYKPAGSEQGSSE